MKTFEKFTATTTTIDLDKILSLDRQDFVEFMASCIHMNDKDLENIDFDKLIDDYSKKIIMNNSDVETNIGKIKSDLKKDIKEFAEKEIDKEVEEKFPYIKRLNWSRKLRDNFMKK